MTDLITKGTGNSRYLKSVANFATLYPTYEAFVAALVAGTLPFDLNGINPNGITQAGTPLNKANLLDDITAAAIGLTQTDPTVNDALLGVLRQTWQEVTRFDVAGTYTWTADFDGKIGVLVVGAGSDGYSYVITTTSSDSNYSYRWSTGGPSGYAENVANIPVASGQVFNVVVGAHGSGGGSSSFTLPDGTAVTANGGSAPASGNAGNSSSGVKAWGGQSGIVGGNGKFGLNLNAVRASEGYTEPDNVWKNINIFTGEQILGAGGGATVNNASDSTSVRVGVGGKNYAGLGGGDGSAKRRSGNAVGGDATMFGCGGGSAVATSGYTATAGSGADGIVIIYRRA